MKYIIVFLIGIGTLAFLPQGEDIKVHSISIEQGKAFKVFTEKCYLLRIPAMLTPSFRMKLTPIFRQADPLKRREPGEGDSDKLTPSDASQYSGMLTPEGLFLGD